MVAVPRAPLRDQEFHGGFIWSLVVRVRENEPDLVRSWGMAILAEPGLTYTQWNAIVALREDNNHAVSAPLQRFANSAMPSRNSTCAAQFNSLRSRDESAVM